MGLGLKRITIPLLVFLALGVAACPAVSPVGGPSHPAGIAPSSDPSDSDHAPSTDDTIADAGNHSTSDTPSGAGIGSTPPPSGGENSIGSSIAVAQGGTFNPKGDGESVGSDQQKEATDWRLRFGVNAWWELSRTVPDTYPIFKNTATDLRMKLEFKSRDADQWFLAGPTPNGTPVVRMVYQPKGQPSSAAQSFEAQAGWALPEGDNVDFWNLTLGEGLVTFTVDYAGVTHPSGSFTTYYSNVDSSTTSAPLFPY